MNITGFLGYHFITIALTVWALLKKSNPWPPVIIAVVLEGFAFYSSASQAHTQGNPFPLGELIGTVAVLLVCVAVVYFRHLYTR